MTSTRIGTTWDVNDAPRLQYTLRDASDQLIDPSTVALRVVDPAGTTTDYTLAGSTVSRASLGVFYRDLPTVTIAGTWRYRWETTAPPTAEEGSFTVRTERVPKIN